MLKVFVGMILGVALVFGSTWALAKYDPVTRAAVLVKVCPTNQTGVLWFLSNDTVDLEWIDEDSAPKAGERAAKLPKESKGTLFVPCPRPKVQ